MLPVATTLLSRAKKSQGKTAAAWHKKKEKVPP
jgi:hypothetical protein